MKFSPLPYLVLAVSITAPGTGYAQSENTKGTNMAGSAEKSAPVKSHKAAGTVKSVDRAAARVTIEHGPVTSLKWPGMTMGFGLRDKALIEKLSPGRRIEFEFVQQGRDYVITSVQPALAHVGHDHGKNATFGSAGKESEVTRAIDVKASDDMRFTPAKIEIRQGETIKFVVTNVGRIKHEFSIGDQASQRSHALAMKKMADMKHEDDATTIAIEPGRIKTVIWKFDKKPASPLEIACHEPGHYEAGMKIGATWAQ